MVVCGSSAKICILSPLPLSRAISTLATLFARDGLACTEEFSRRSRRGGRASRISKSASMAGRRTFPITATRFIPQFGKRPVLCRRESISGNIARGFTARASFTVAPRTLLERPSSSINSNSNRHKLSLLLAFLFITMSAG